MSKWQKSRKCQKYETCQKIIKIGEKWNVRKIHKKCQRYQNCRKVSKSQKCQNCQMLKITKNIRHFRTFCNFINCRKLSTVLKI